MKFINLVLLIVVYMVSFIALTFYGEQPPAGYEDIWTSANLLISVIPVVVVLAMIGVVSLWKK